MLFNSYVFLFAFLPVSLAGFFAIGKLGGRAASVWLIAASLVFYGWWNPAFLPLLGVSMFANFLISRWLLAVGERPQLQGWLLGGAIALNLMALVYYKYLAAILGFAGIVVADPEGRIKSFQEKPKPEEAKSTLASTGIYIFEPEVLDLVPSGQVYDIGSQLFPQLVAQKLPFYAQNRFFNWIDIGRVSDYWSVLQRVLRGEIAEMTMPGREVRPGVWVGLNTCVAWDEVEIQGPVYIGSSVKIEPGASIVGPCWIGHGSVIRAGATVTRSVLLEYTRIAAGMHFKEMIISPEYCVNRAGETLYRGDETVQLRWGDARA